MTSDDFLGLMTRLAEHKFPKWDDQELKLQVKAWWRDFKDLNFDIADFIFTRTIACADFGDLYGIRDACWEKQGDRNATREMRERQAEDARIEAKLKAERETGGENDE